MAIRGGLRLPRSEGSRGHRAQAQRATPGGPPAAKKKKITASEVWREARTLVLAHRGRLAIGLSLMLVNRAVGFVLPATSKFLIDDVIGRRRADLLVPL